MARSSLIAAFCLLLGLVAGSLLVYLAFPRVKTDYKVETVYKYVRPPAQPLETYSFDEAMAVLTDRPAWTDFPPLDLPRLPTESALKGMVIVLDPGHGGADGATDRAGPTGIREKHINLQVARMTEKHSPAAAMSKFHSKNALPSPTT
jgi:N-acetylmuramoyl-L-alanine amidase